MKLITMYTTTWCPDCRRAKSFLRESGVNYREVNIEEVEAGEEIVVRANDGKQVVPTFEIGGRFFACSPFNAQQLSFELNLPLNP